MDEITMIAAGALRSSIRYQNNTANAARNVTANPTSLRILIFIIRNGGHRPTPQIPPPPSGRPPPPTGPPLTPKNHPSHRTQKDNITPAPPSTSPETYPSP